MMADVTDMNDSWLIKMNRAVATQNPWPSRADSSPTVCASIIAGGKGWLAFVDEMWGVP